MTAFPLIPAALGIAPRQSVMTAVPRGRFAGVWPALDRLPDPAGSPGRQRWPLTAGRGPQSPPGASESAPQAPGGLGSCQTELIPPAGSFAASRICGAVPAVYFAGRCKCGHPIKGWSCAACLQSAGRGCLTCWRKPPRGQERHECAVLLGEVAAPGRPP